MPESSPLPSPAPDSDRSRLGRWLFVGHLVSIFGLALSNGLFLLTGLWCLLRRGRLHTLESEADRVERNRVLLPVGLYAVAFSLSAVFSYRPELSLPELSELLSLATLPLALWLIRGTEQVRSVLSALIVAAAVFALWGLTQMAFGGYGSLASRMPGPFSHYMTFSGVLLLGLCLVMARMVALPVPSARPSRERPRWERPALWLCWLLLAVTLLLTLTRSAWLAAAAVTLWVIWHRARRQVLSGLAVGALALSLLALASPGLWPRIQSIVDPQNASNYDRVCMAYAGGQMVLERPILGIGPGLVGEYYPHYRLPSAPRVRVEHLHNTFVNMAAERGLASLAAYLLLLGLVLSSAYRRYLREGGPSGPRADLLLGCVLGLVALSLAGLAEANWRDTEVQRWALFLLAIPACLPATKDAPAIAEP